VIGPCRRIVLHLVAVKRPWLYTLKTGEEAAYLRLGGGMAVHLGSGSSRLRLKALCFEVTKRVLPFREGNAENHGTRNMKQFEKGARCFECQVALDQALDSGRAAANERATLAIAEGT
jgi:hypothetical protein